MRRRFGDVGCRGLAVAQHGRTPLFGGDCDLFTSKPRMGGFVGLAAPWDHPFLERMEALLPEGLEANSFADEFRCLLEVATDGALIKRVYDRIRLSLDSFPIWEFVDRRTIVLRAGGLTDPGDSHIVHYASAQRGTGG